MIKSIIVILLAHASLTLPVLAAEPDWSRDEGMKACLKNCLSKIQQAPPSKQPRLACDNRCTCIIDEMFDPGGNPRRDQRDLAKVAAECKVRLSPKAAPQPEAAPTPAPKPAVLAGTELLPGTNCNKAKMPGLQYDPDEHRVQLAGAKFKMRLPRGWSAELERPDLVVVSAPESAKGVRPVFEMFVSPVCKTYDGLYVNQRVAARGLIALLSPEATMDQVKKGRWSVGLGGPVGENLVLHDVALKTDKGERTVVLYSTQLGDSKTFGLHAAAVCPKGGEKQGELGACEKTYFDMLEKAEY